MFSQIAYLRTKGKLTLLIRTLAQFPASKALVFSRSSYEIRREKGSVEMGQLGSLTLAAGKTRVKLWTSRSTADWFSTSMFLYYGKCHGLVKLIIVR